MEKLLTDYHGTEALAALLALNVLMTVGRFLWKLFEKKTKETEIVHKDLERKTTEKDKEIEQKANDLYAKLARVEGQLDSIAGPQLQRLMNTVGSYMETTINLSSKIGGVEKQMEIMIEMIEKFDLQIEELKDLTRELRK